MGPGRLRAVTMVGAARRVVSGEATGIGIGGATGKSACIGFAASGLPVFERLDPDS